MASDEARIVDKIHYQYTDENKNFKIKGTKYM
jgi:hypothetical protein